MTESQPEPAPATLSVEEAEKGCKKQSKYTVTPGKIEDDPQVY